jgi:hypothetical protein
MADPFEIPVWKVADPAPIHLVPDGRTYTFNKGDIFYVNIPTDHQGIYRCRHDLISTSITPDPDDPTKFNTIDFDTHVNSPVGDTDFEYLTRPEGTEITEWVPRKKYYLNNKVFLKNRYDNYYICIVAEIEQPVFSLTEGGFYPFNPNNQVPERIVSGIRNEGFYLYPRGPLADLKFVPKWPGMMYLCTDTGNRSIYAYTDGKGPIDGWDIYAKADDGSRITLKIGMIIGWLWSPDDTIPIPANTLKCDGTRVSKTIYADLYALIGDRYLQSGDDPADNLFRLPEAYNQIIVTGV